MNALRTVFAEYAIAYRDCYRWLYRICPPWRWLLSAGLVPGSAAWKASQELRCSMLPGAGPLRCAGTRVTCGPAPSRMGPGPHQAPAGSVTGLILGEVAR